MTDYVKIGSSRLGFDPHPDQTALGVLLDGARETNAVCWPRRGGKTTGVWAWIIGRCAEVDGEQWITTAQSGVKARDRFMSMARLVDKHWPEDQGGPHIYRGAGHEAFEFANGSRLWVVAPKPDSFRGDGANVYIDEPQELDLAQSADLEQAVYPLFDTFPGRVVLSGTPGRARSGWFWKALQGGEGHAVSWFAIPDHLDVDDPDNWTEYHPGLKWGLTTLDKMKARHDGMSEAAWRQEYCGQWPYDSATGAFDMGEWGTAAVDFTERPERVGIAFDVAIDSTSATLATAWRDETGKAFVEIVDHRAGMFTTDSGPIWEDSTEVLTYPAPFPAGLHKVLIWEKEYGTLDVASIPVDWLPTSAELAARLARHTTRDRVLSITAPADPTIRPGMALATGAPSLPGTTSVVTAVTLRVPADTMDITAHAATDV